MKYEQKMKCSGCAQEISKIVNITTLHNCQSAIENTLTSLVCRTCKRQNDVIRIQGDFIELTPLLILKFGNLEIPEKNIEKKINLIHQYGPQYFQLIGHTLLLGNHFTLKTLINTTCYHYDGMRNKKIQLEETSNLQNTV